MIVMMVTGMLMRMEVVVPMIVNAKNEHTGTIYQQAQHRHYNGLIKSYVDRIYQANDASQPPCTGQKWPATRRR